MKRFDGGKALVSWQLNRTAICIPLTRRSPEAAALANNQSDPHSHLGARHHVLDKRLSGISSIYKRVRSRMHSPTQIICNKLLTRNIRDSNLSPFLASSRKISILQSLLLLSDITRLQYRSKKNNNR